MGNESVSRMRELLKDAAPAAPRSGKRLRASNHGVVVDGDGNVVMVVHSYVPARRAVSRWRTYIFWTVALGVMAFGATLVWLRSLFVLWWPRSIWEYIDSRWIGATSPAQDAQMFLISAQVGAAVAAGILALCTVWWACTRR